MVTPHLRDLNPDSQPGAEGELGPTKTGGVLNLPSHVELRKRVRVW